MVACCRCESGTCVRCACSRARRPCASCRPGEIGRCANSCAQTTTLDEEADSLAGQQSVDGSAGVAWLLFRLLEMQEVEVGVS